MTLWEYLDGIPIVEGISHSSWDDKYERFDGVTAKFFFHTKCFCSDSEQHGTPDDCVQALVGNHTFIWHVVKCDAKISNTAICQKAFSGYDRIGCYAQPKEEDEGCSTIASQFDLEKLCGDACFNGSFFTSNHNFSCCCLGQRPMGGLVPGNQCEADFNQPDDKYSRTVLLKRWSVASCPAPQDNLVNFTYVVWAQGVFLPGSKAHYKCTPGFELNKDFLDLVRIIFQDISSSKDRPCRT